MNFQQPIFRKTTTQANHFIGIKFSLPYNEQYNSYDLNSDLTSEIIEQYVDYYPKIDEQATIEYADDIKYLLANAILLGLSLHNETVFTQSWHKIKYKILQMDFHIHEFLVHSWGNKDLESPENKDFSFLIIALREVFENRYLRSITYTFEPHVNLNVRYDAYKITCFEDENSILGNFEVHNASEKEDNIWYSHTFKIDKEKWSQITQMTKEIGIPITCNHYFDKESHSNHKLEMYNINNILFYKYNFRDDWTTMQISEHNFILKNGILEIVNFDIEKMAEALICENTAQLDKNYYSTMSTIAHINQNAATWDEEFHFLEKVINTRFDLKKGGKSEYKSIYEIKLPILSDHSSLGQLVKKFDFKFEERLILALAMVVHLCPEALDAFFKTNEKTLRTFSEVGGLKGKFHSGYIPTLETAIFLLAGKDISKRIQILQLFGEGSIFTKNNIIRIEVKEATEPKYAGQLVMSDEYVEYLTTGRHFKPDYTSNFPAQMVTTELDWTDLYLEKETISEINNIETWLTHQQKIMVDLKLKKHLKQGYRALFYGTSGTGKTLTATLLGKNLGLDVYKVDLSMISSKYIGETTKNLARLFDMAESKNWVLFFDEAESLFGRRSKSIERATDSYYNQDVGYLLQRIENYDGLVVLATNLLDNIDTAFMRRFQSLVYFPVPSATQQLALWKNIFAEGLPLSKNISLKELAEKHTLTASNITNILRDVTIKTLQNKEPKIIKKILTEAIGRELKKANQYESVGFKLQK